MAADSPLLPEELVRYVLAAGESDGVDAKAPLTWDGAEHSASLTKDILAFANSRDGGVIVIGKSETAGSGFSLDGLTNEQAASFDTTKVAAWVNSRAAPPVRLVCQGSARVKDLRCNGGPRV